MCVFKRQIWKGAHGMGIAPVHVPVRSSSERGLEGLLEKTESAVAIATPVAAVRIVSDPIFQESGNVIAIKTEMLGDADDLLSRDFAFGDAGGD